MTLDQLRALLSIHDAGSVAEAARRHGTPRSTLKRRVEELEAHLQVPLVHMTHRGVSLTPAGLDLVQRSRAIVAQVDNITSEVRGQQTWGLIRVAYPVGLHPSLLITSTRLLTRMLPRMRFQALVGVPLDDPSRYDIAIYIGEIPEAGPFVARAITRVPVRLMASSAYGKPLPTRVEELGQHSLFAWSSDPAPLTSLPLVGGGTVAVQPRVVTPDLHYLHWVGRAGLGLVYVGDGNVREEPGVEPLKPVMPDVVGTEMPVWLLIPAATRSVAWMRSCVDTLASMLDIRELYQS